MRPDFESSAFSFLPTKTFAPSRAAAVSLPPDLAFLRACHVDVSKLTAAAEGAVREGVSAGRHLRASDGVSDMLYYLALARRLGVPFLDGWTRLSPGLDPVVALQTGRALLASGGGPLWLLSPSDADVVLLLEARRAGLASPPIMITTPHHFCALIRSACTQAICYELSEALPMHRPGLSAKGATDRNVGRAVCAGLLLTLIVLVAQPRVVVDVLGSLFSAAMVFRLIVSAAGLSRVSSSDERLHDADLPPYTILVPLHDEAGMVEGLVTSLAALDYPRSKLAVLFLLEPDDDATRVALLARMLPPGFQVIMLPRGHPTTKPRALNLGLMLAQDGLVTVFDAEDRPDVDQLRKAAATFAASSPIVGCLQARLAISNGGDRLLSRLFALEYAALFDVFNIGLSRWTLPAALGGTSNHFRTAVLRSIGGWDAWNVTEDADLGLRLARFGYETQTLDSTTWEEAPKSLDSWFKQRRRWTKGWMQTLLVLTRDASAARDLGPVRTLLVALMLTNLVTSPLLLPPIVVGVGIRLLRDGLPSPAGLLTLVEATLAGSVAMLGIGSTLWCGYAGMRQRGLERFWAALPWLLPYQVLIGLAAWGGLWDLCRRPYHWHKTDHGEPGDRRAPRSAPS